MVKKVLFALFVVSAVAAGSYGYIYLRNLKKPRLPATTLIPAHCTFVVESEDLIGFFKKLNETNLIWNEVQEIEEVNRLNQHYHLLDSIAGLSEKIAGMFSGNKVYMAAYPDEHDKYRFIFAMNLPDINYTGDVQTFLKTHAEKQEIKDLGDGQKMQELHFKNITQSIWFYLNAGVLVASADQELLTKAVLSKGQHSLHEDADYTKLEESAGTDAGFRFFYNHAFSRKQSHCFNDKLGRTGLLDITNTAGWTELDIDFSPNEVTLNGYTLCDSSKMMRAITTQEPVELKFAESAPASTRAFAFLGISNREKFAANMMLSGETEEEREKYDRKLDINLMNSVTQLAAEELLVLYTSDNDTNATYGLVGINDQENCLKFLKETCDSVSACGANDSVFVYNDAAVFGAFTFHLYSFTPHCCALLNNYLLFAENPGDIQRYKAQLIQNQTLAHNEKFLRFSENHLNTETSLYLYTSFSGLRDFISSFFNSQINALFNTHHGMFEKFNAFGYQLSASKGRLLNQAYLLYSPSDNQQNNSVWETQMDTVCNMVPEIVINHKTGGREVFVQDASGKLYLISNTGKIIWTKKIEGHILGKVYQADYFKNGKLQLLFNTESALHLIDRNGNYVQGYPVRLKALASAGMSVFDYENNKDYRLIIPCSDKKIYNYNIQGQAVEGFDFPVTAAVVKLSPQWLRINQKDYLIAADSTGHIYGTGRRGEPRLNFKHRLPEGIRNWYFDLGKDISKSYVLAMDGGNNIVVKLSLSDELQNIPVENELKIREVRFSAINDNQLVDYITADESGFQVHDDEGRILLNYVSREELLPFVTIIAYDNRPYFLIAEKSTLRGHIINTAGKMAEGLNFSTGNEPVLNTINNDAQTYLITTSGNKVLCYAFALKAG